MKLNTMLLFVCSIVGRESSGMTIEKRVEQLLNKSEVAAFAKGLAERPQKASAILECYAGLVLVRADLAKRFVSVYEMNQGVIKEPAVSQMSLEKFCALVNSFKQGSVEKDNKL